MSGRVTACVASVLQAWRPLLIGVGMLIGLPLAQPTIPWGTSVLLILGNGLVVHWIAAQRLRDARLAALLWSGLAVRVLLSLTLYLASVWGLPLLPSLQLGNGFWSFAPDAIWHHDAALWILETWHKGVAPPLELGWYYFLLAAWYALVGISPLHGIFLNVTVNLLSGVAAYAIAARLGGRSAGRLAAAVIVFWPSMVWWSTQLLKEDITVLAVLLAFYGFMRAYDGLTSNSPWLRRAVGMLVLLIGLAGPLGVLAVIRPLYAIALSLAAAVVCGGWAVRAALKRRIGTAAMLCVLVITACSATRVGQSIEVYAWVSPRMPWVGYFKGHRQAAEREFRKAIELRAAFHPPHEAMAVLLAEEPSPQEFATLAPVVGQASSPNEPAVTPVAPRPRPVRVTATPRRVLSAQWVAKKSSDIWIGWVDQTRYRARAAFRRASKIMVEFPEAVKSIRDGQVSAASSSRIYPDADVSSYPKIAKHLLKGWWVTVFAPFPTEVLGRDRRGVTGILKDCSIIESLFLYLLMPFAVLGCVRGVRSGHAGLVWLLALYFVSGMAALTLFMANLGSLFRYRVPFFIPLAILASVGGLPAWLQKGADDSWRFRERHKVTT